MTADARPEIHTTPIGEDGTADQIVFLHGLFGQGKNFTSIAKALQPDFASLLVDLPNHGRSQWAERVDFEQMADAVAAEVRRSFAPEGRVHLVGHSMGGKVAMAVALRHPDLIERLVVVDISPVESSDMGEFRHLLSALATLDLDDLPSRTEANDRLSELIPNRTVRGFLLQNLRSEGDGWRWQANLDVLLRDLPRIGGYAPEGDPFDRPVLWISGERSPYVQPEHRPAMEAIFPRTMLLTIKDAGHWVHSEKPEAFVSALRTFLTAPARE